MRTKDEKETKHENEAKGCCHGTTLMSSRVSIHPTYTILTFYEQIMHILAFHEEVPPQLCTCFLFMRIVYTGCNKCQVQDEQDGTLFISNLPINSVYTGCNKC